MNGATLPAGLAVGLLAGVLAGTEAESVMTGANTTLQVAGLAFLFSVRQEMGGLRRELEDLRVKFEACSHTECPVRKQTTHGRRT